MPGNQNLECFVCNDGGTPQPADYGCGVDCAECGNTILACGE